MPKHKTLGQVFTPQWIVAEILDMIGYNGASILDKYIMEPSCGDGAFLCEIVNRYIDVCLDNNIAPKDIITRLSQYIYAIEIDEEEQKKSIDRLNDIVFNKLNITSDIKWQIYNQNTLLVYKNYKNHFDFVVGNPPYIRIHNLDTKTREILKRDFLFTEGTIDIYLSFFEMGLYMLKPNGRLGYITPNSYLHNSSYRLFREYLKRERLIKTLVDFKSNKIFNGYSTYTAITIIGKNNQDNDFEYKELRNNHIVLVNKVKFDNIDAKDWSFTDSDNEIFLQELNDNRKSAIKDFFDVQYGFATLRDKIFISHIEPYSDDLVYFNKYPIEKSILKKVIKGSRFRGAIDEKEMILFPYELANTRYRVIAEQKLAHDYPYAYKYLQANRKELESRDLDKGAVWYEFGRSQGIQTIHKEKIILSTLVYDKISFYKVSDDVMMYSGLFIVKKKPYSNWEILENVLKSNEFYQYIRLTGKDFSGGYKSITSKQIKEFRINAHNPEQLF
jgi:hypothetical protein